MIWTCQWEGLVYGVSHVITNNNSLSPPLSSGKWPILNPLCLSLSLSFLCPSVFFFIIQKFHPISLPLSQVSSLKSQKHGGMFLSLLSRHPSPQATHKHKNTIHNYPFVYTSITCYKICLCIILEFLLGLACANFLSVLATIWIDF